MTPGTGWQPSDEFIDRVKRAYRAALCDDGQPPRRSIWGAIGERQRDVHTALIVEDPGPLREIFSNPATTDLFYGVDNLCRSFIGNGALNEDNLAEEAAHLFKVSGIGAYPFTFPNPFAGEAGVETPAGLASHRAILSAAQAAKLSSLGAMGSSVLEIGPGLGRTALHARQIGITDYTTVDLPLGIVAQACFLGAALGPDAIRFATDDGRDQLGCIKLMTFKSIRRNKRRYDLVLNVDSMVEMDPFSAAKYAWWISRNAGVFLSINRDYRRMKIGYLAPIFFRTAVVARAPWPLRDGYNEHLFRFLSSARTKPVTMSAPTSE